MKLYWPSAIVKYSGLSKEPCQWYTYDGCDTFDQALKSIEAMRQHETVYCAWINEEDTQTKAMRQVYFNCYTNSIGYVKKPESSEIKEES